MYILYKSTLYFPLHQKVLALIYYIRKLFTPLKNPAFTANVHSPPIFTEIQRCESEKNRERESENTAFLMTTSTFHQS